MYRTLLRILMLATAPVLAQTQFTSLDSLMNYAQRNSSASRISAQQEDLAKWTEVAALANSINFRNPVSFMATNNLLLPVNFIPADAFGGPAGSFRQITLGQQYVTNFNFNPQIDILNPYNIAKVKSSRVNRELAAMNTLVVRKNQFENLAVAYYNYQGMQKQEEVMKKSLQLADSLLLLLTLKLEEGLIREQDLNNALANQINVKDKLSQLQANLKVQENGIRILTDIPASNAISLPMPADLPATEVNSNSALQAKYQSAQVKYYKSELWSMRASMLPVLSLVYYQGWQRNSNVSFSDAGSGWIESKYVGIKLTMPFPPDAGKLSQTYSAKVSARIADLNSGHMKIQEELTNRSMDTEVLKCLSTFSSAKQIVLLRSANYDKSLQQFREGLMPAEMLIQSFNDLLSSQLNESVAWSAAEISKSKIIINNRIK